MLPEVRGILGEERWPLVQARLEDDRGKQGGAVFSLTLDRILNQSSQDLSVWVETDDQGTPTMGYNLGGAMASRGSGALSMFLPEGDPNRTDGAQNTVFGGDYLIPMAGSYGRHPITENFSVATFYPTARSLGLSPSPPPDIGYEVLVRSSFQSWAETNKTKMEKGEASYDAGQDQKGPLTLAVLITLSTKDQKGEAKGPGEKKEKAPKGRMALFGDSDFADNGYFNLSGNGDLFLNTVNYLTEEEALIAIRPAKSPIRPLSLSSAQASALFVIPMILLPLLVIGAGILVWRLRRKAR